MPWNKGKKMSEAVIQKNRESHLGQSAWNRGKTLPKKTHCKRGHPRLPENIYKNGACKICSLARNILPEEKIRRAIWGKSPAGRVYRNSPQAKSVKMVYDHKRYATQEYRDRQRLLTNTPQRKAVHKVCNHRRRARMKGHRGSSTAPEWLSLKSQYGHKCLCCCKTEDELILLGRTLVPDHVISICNGGLNAIENLQPLCHGRGGCNNRKSSRNIDFRVKKEIPMRINTCQMSDDEFLQFLQTHPVSGSCGTRGAENQAAAAQNSFTSQMISEGTQVFGQDNAVFNQLVGNYTPILRAGPSQAGYSAAEDNALKAQIVQSTAVGARNVAAAAKAGVAGVGGGNTVMTSGTGLNLNAGIAENAMAT